MQRYALPDARFHVIGRHDQNDEKTGLWWSGSGVRFQCACTQIDVEITSTARDHAQYIALLVDDAPVARLPLQKGTHRYTVMAGLVRDFPHEYAILRDTQPSYDEEGPIALEAVWTDGEPAAPADRDLLLEFVGDSLTVGEGTLGPETAMEWRMPWISHVNAFPSLVSADLRAEKRVIALGGWGAARSWDNHPECRLGMIYEKLCAVTPGGDRPSDPNERAADAVIINLGTNDSSALKTMDEPEKALARADLRSRAAELMEMVRRKNPDAVILWAYGLCGNDVEDSLRGAVQDRQDAGDGRVFYLSLSQAESNGSRMHPSRKAHEKAAAEIEAALKQYLRL